MNKHYSKIVSTSILTLLCFAGMNIQAQQRGGGGGGFGGGGFGGGGGGGGGFGGGGGAGNRATQYNPNGAVGGATFMVDPDTKSLIVITDEETSASVFEVLKSLDRPKPQVLIKVVFLEVVHNNSSDIGVEGAFGNRFGAGLTNSVAQVFGINGLNSITTNFNVAGPAQAIPSLTTSGSGAGLYQILGSDFQATLRAIAQAGKAQLLSRPSILARDGQPATIVVGQSVPLVSGVTYYSSGGTVIPINNVEYTDVGIILRVTPYISPQGYVEMIVQPSTTAVNGTQRQTIAPGVDVPFLDVRSADTVVITPDLQTVVIGGLMGADKSSFESKVPLLGDIPVLGNLFKRRVTSGLKTELLIFLTPHIVKAPGQLVAMAAHEQSHTLTPKSYSEAELDRFLEKVPMKKK
jgi:general secretion pathway protein D